MMNKEKMNCFTYGKTGHFSRECPEAKWKPHLSQKSANTIETEAATPEYGNLLPSAFSVCYSPDWWVDTGANIHVCADISLFSFYQTRWAGSLLMGNWARAAVRDVGTVDLKLTSGKTVQLRNVHHVPSIRKNLISGSLLCRDGHKLVFESNKCVISKFGTFIGKGYESIGLFRLSLVDTCSKSVNHVVGNIETDIWHSRLCHVNFGCMSRLAGLNLIPKFYVVKSLKCHVCVEAKQPRKSHKAAVARELAPLDLIHSDICEINGILTKGGKRYFITFIDDCTWFCYVYLMKTKDEALHYFKIYKAEVENQLEKKIKRLWSDRGIIHERTSPYSP
jgi:hypothetical protein